MAGQEKRTSSCVCGAAGPEMSSGWCCSVCCSRQGALCGLDNCGNYCYLNAALQCLIHTPTLTYHLLHTPHSSTRQTGLVGAFCRLVEDVCVSGRQTFSPDEFRVKVCELHPRFNNNNQHDSHEFLLILLNTLHQELTMSEDSVVTHLFEGELGYDKVCVPCSHHTHTSQIFTILSLPLPPHCYRCSLQECLDLFFKQCVLSGDEQKLCVRCGEKRDKQLITTITKLPQILILHLNRVDCQGGKKRKRRVNVVFSLDCLDLSPFVSCTPEQDTLYSLYAVLNHTGDLDRGHFYTCCRHTHTHAWHKFDDAMVTEIQEHLLQSPSAYMLFYTHTALHS